MRASLAVLALVIGALFTHPLRAADAAGITVQDGYVRLPPPGSPAVAYFTLKNAGVDRALVDVDCRCAGMTMIHESAEKNGMATMRHVDSAALPKGGELVLKPGGLHVMLMQLQAPLKLGDAVKLTLTFADGDTLLLTLPVQAR